MEISRKFKARSKNGVIEIKNRPIVPVKVTIKSATLVIDTVNAEAVNAEPGKSENNEKDCEILVNGECVFDGRCAANQEIKFKPAIQLAPGMPKVVIRSGPYESQVDVSGRFLLKVTVG